MGARQNDVKTGFETHYNPNGDMYEGEFKPGTESAFGFEL